MANEGNLKPVRTKEEARERGRRGGKASGEARRQKKAMRETVIAMLECGLTPEFEKALREKAPIALGKGKLTAEDAMIFRQMIAAMNGDTRAAVFIRDTAGENPIEKVEVSAGVESAAESIAAAVAKRKARKDG